MGDGKSKACPERSRMGQKSKCKITVQKLALSAVEWVKNSTVCSTIVENVLQIDLFLQNKANFQKSQMDVSFNMTRDYEKKLHWTFGENKPNFKAEDRCQMTEDR